MQDPARVDHLRSRDQALPRALAQRFEDLGDLCVEPRVAAEHVKDALGVLQQARQLGVERLDRMRVVRPVVGLRALDTRPVAVPDLALAIARLDEQREGRAAVGP